MCTCVNISVTKWCIVGYLFGALWYLSDGFIMYLVLELEEHLDVYFSKFKSVYTIKTSSQLVT